MKVSQNQILNLKDLFKQHRRRRFSLDRIFEGSGGWVDAEADDEFEPKVARLRLGKVALFGGDPDLPAARDLVENLKTTIAVTETTGWHDLVCQANSNRRIEKWTRTEFDSGKLDLSRLRQLEQHENSEFRVEPLNLNLARRLKEELGTGFGRFRSIEAFLETGFGATGLLGDTLVCAAHSAVICRRGIEIQINTHPDYLRRGFATAVGASLIIQSLQRDLEPNWSAATSVSANLARKLGYIETDSYEDMHIFE